MQTAQIIVRAAGVSRIYRVGSNTVAGLLDIDLEIYRGELVLLKGESGSGKSTLLSLLAGLDLPTDGGLTVDGLDLKSASEARLTRYRRESVGMVFQSFNLLPGLKVIENVCLPGLLAGRRYPKTRTRAMALLDELNLAQRHDHFPAQLSGGEKQRVAIARALINDPSIVLADEPTGNLDSRNGQTVIDLLAQINRTSHRTVVVATHSDIADAIGTRWIVLRDGRVEIDRCTA